MPATNAADLERLLGDIARGDRRAFQALYGATSAKLYGVVLRISRDAGLAQDVLQETYVKVWTRAGRYRGSEGSPIGWLVAIARNTAIDGIRRRSDIALGMDADGRSVVEDLAAAVAGPDPEDTRALKGCLEALEEPQRDCIVLAYCWGSSREELAEKFDRPVGTIKTWLHRGLLNLRACLDGK